MYTASIKLMIKEEEEVNMILPRRSVTKIFILRCSFALSRNFALLFQVFFFFSTHKILKTASLESEYFVALYISLSNARH